PERRAQGDGPRVRRAIVNRLPVALDVLHRPGRPHPRHRQERSRRYARRRHRGASSRARHLMTLLDRFRTPSRQKHPDPAVRLAYVAELPLSERDLIIAAAREDEDTRVRRAAVAKLLDPAMLASIARDDADASVRDQ